MVHSSYDALPNVTTFPGHANQQLEERGHHSLLAMDCKNTLGN